MTFEQYLHGLIEYIEERSHKAIEPQDIFSSLVLFDVKLAYLDGMSFEDYRKSINN